MICPTPLIWYYLGPRNWNSPPGHTQSPDWRFLKSRVFWTYQTANVIQSVGYFLPGIYLASFAKAIGLSAWDGIILTAILNGSGSISSIIIGRLSDISDVPNIVISSMAAGGVSILLFWGLADNMAHLSIFAVLYGLVAGGFTSSYSGMAREICKDCPNVSDTWMMGILSTGRGVGPITCSIISFTLLSSVPQEYVKQGYGSAYEGIIVFSGLTGVLGGAAMYFAKRRSWI